MEKETNKSSFKNVLIAILLVILIPSIGLNIYNYIYKNDDSIINDDVVNNENNKKEEKTTTEVKEESDKKNTLSGIYGYESRDSENEELVFSDYIQFDEDGYFYHTYGDTCHDNSVGTYTIDGDKLKLQYGIISYSCGGEGENSDYTKEYTINKDGSFDKYKKSNKNINIKKDILKFSGEMISNYYKMP